MFIIKKSTIKNFYSYHIKLIFYKYSVIAFFSFLNLSTNLNLNKFKNLCFQNSLKFLSIVGKFANPIFKEFSFFNFFKNYHMLVYSNNLSSLFDFFNILSKTMENVILTALCVDGFFFNLFLFDLNKLNFSKLKHGNVFFFIESVYVFLSFFINFFILCIFL